jgi:hypothetical protein
VHLQLKIVNDVAKHQEKIKKGIRKYGNFAEHNYIHYLYSETKWNKNLFFDFGNDKVVLAQFDKSADVWSLFPNSILAPENERLDLLLKVADHVLRKEKSKKFVVEVSEGLRKQILDKFRIKNGFRACSADVLYWPMYNMNSWDRRLKGNKWKKLRNIKNRFYRNNKVKVVDSIEVPKQQLKEIVSDWLKKRNDTDRVEKSYYFNLIDNGFKGMDMAKTMNVNGKPCTITAGWKIPNTRNFYSSIGILDYSNPGLGEAANLEDLDRLKKEGYDYVDFGGSDKVLLSFKMKFRPEKIYKTYIFSVVRS